MTGRHFELTREQILAYRRRVQALDQRLPPGSASLRRAAGIGLQDSVPRSALHALHARVTNVRPDALDDPSLIQVWGPRYAVYVVPAGEHVPFTLGRMPAGGRLPARAQDLAVRAETYLAGRRLRAEEVARAIGTRHLNEIRYAALTGTLMIRWDGARDPLVWTVPRSRFTPEAALQELARRYLHMLGPSTVDAFTRWGGLDARATYRAFEALAAELLPLRTPLGEALILAADEPALRQQPEPTDAVRLLPSGDHYYLLWNADRELLVPQPAHRARLWTTRVWPGAVLIAGEIVGTWRRSKAMVQVAPWRRLTATERQGIEAEAASLPLPEVTTERSVVWHAHA